MAGQLGFGVVAAVVVAATVVVAVVTPVDAVVVVWGGATVEPVGGALQSLAIL